MEFYVGLVLPKAWQDTLAQLGWKRVAVVILIFQLLGFIGLATVKGRRFAFDEFVATASLSLIPGALAWTVVFLVNVAMAPVRLMMNHERFARDSARLTRVLQRLQPPRLTPDQRTLFLKALEGVERQPVLIIYLDTPTSRAGAYASDLVDTFRSAMWHAGMRGERAGYEYCEGVSMNIEAITHIRPAQQAVLDAFQNISAPVTRRPGHDVAERVELIVGEMDVT